MADLPTLLAVLEHDPDDAQALEALTGAARQSSADVRVHRFAAARRVLAGRGRPDALVQLLDIELAATAEVDRKADLLLEKGMVLDGELLDVPAARAAFEAARALRPDDSMAKEALDEIELAASNWQKFAEKYLREADSATDRGLATSLYVSAAEAHVRFAPDEAEAEAYLRKALEIEPRNSKAAFHLARLLRRQARWSDLAALYEERAELAPAVEEKIAALWALAETARAQLGADGAARADAAIRRVLQLDPAHPHALRVLADQLAASQNWLALVGAYQAALKARRDHDDLGILLQIAMVLWKHVGDLDQAEEYFRRVRKLDPAHAVALDFYRAYYPAKGENQKLLALLRQVEKSPRARRESVRPIGVEIAQLAEAQNNPERAIEAWKQHLRSEPTAESSGQAREALARLYRRTEKWNALLDLMKEEIERLPADDVEGRVRRLHDVVEIYRDKLRLDVMVINTYNAILKLDPDNRQAIDELAAKFRALGRWNDLIAVLTRQAESHAPAISDAERVALLREIANLWSERFGNFANAIRPLEKILELAPGDVDALTRLKEIYTKRRQWRALIDVLAREASVLPLDEKRAKHTEMARLAAERLGDTRLAIEIYNGILADAAPVDHPETLASLAALYEREKRWMPLAEVLHRQVAVLVADGADAGAHRTAVALLEKLGQVYADRLGAPQSAAGVWQQVLELDPAHARALRTLRELYATAGDFHGLEKLYARLGQEEELVDALLAIADRLEGKAQRLPLVERAAQLAQQRADAAPLAPAGAPRPASARSRRVRTADSDESPADQALERARQVWERVLAVEPQHTGAAAALAPIYAKQAKWSRLITVLEVELAAAPDVPTRLAKVAEIRRLCEQRLASRTLAFTWTLRAFDLDPASEPLYADVLRLASEPDQWREAAALFEKHAAPEAGLDERSESMGGGDPTGFARGAGVLPRGNNEVRLTLLRELAKIASRRLADPERARGYHRAVLAIAPEDREAEQHLEELAIQLADWPELLASYRRRAAREKDSTERASLLIEIASLQEEKLADLDGAAATYNEALQALPGQLRALRALARIEEARGDWDSLVGVLAVELQQTPDGQARFDLLMRLGDLEEQQLERMSTALAYYRDAIAIPAPSGGARPRAVSAIARFLPADGPGGRIDPRERVAAARLVLPHFEAERGATLPLLALALEVIRGGAATPDAERLDIDRRLMRLYFIELDDPAQAWVAGLRVIGADPADTEIRSALGSLASQLNRDGEWARHLAAALAALQGGTGQPGQIRSVATELAELAAQRLDDHPTAERAWLAVLEVEPAAPDAFDALAAAYRGDHRWTDLRALLERRADVALDDATRRGVLLELAALEADVLDEPGRAMAAHRRILELDRSYAPSYEALDRLYTAAQQWPDLEALLAQKAAHAGQPREQVELAYRRAQLFAHRLEDAERAVDLLDEVIGRQRSHADARELLEELLPQPPVTLRVARLLEPLYEQDKLWRDLVGVLRAQRSLATGTEAVELLSRIATIEETELGGAHNAFNAWIEVLALDPTHERARSELARLARALERWPEATAALEAAAAAAPAGDVATRSALLGELAAYYDAQLGDAPRAINAYRRLLDMDVSNPATVRRAGAALARLYQQAGAWSDLRAVMRKQAEWADAPGERRALLGAVAALEEEQLADRDAAITTWRDILDDHPADTGAVDALERLYDATERWRELIDILRRKLDHADQVLGVTAPLGRTLLGRIALIHEAMLDEPDEAIAAHLEVLERDAADPSALAELARLYRSGGRHADLLEVLERQAQLDADARTALQVEIAQLLAGPLARPVEAIERWAAVLEDEPHHVYALTAVEQAIEEPDLRMMAADVLRPVYDDTNQHEKLAALYHRIAEWADEPAAKLRSLAEVVAIREHRLGDKAGAFDAQRLALQHAATEPELARVIAETERLAGELGREADLIDAYREVAPNVLDAEIQRLLYLDVADLSRGVRRDLTVAREYYDKVLQAQPEDARALRELESIYRETANDEALTEILLRQADAAHAGVDDRVGALVEAAGLYDKLARPDDAIATWEQVLAVAPERRDAVDALEVLYRAQGRWPDVVDLYERRLGFATSVEEAVELRVQLGEIHEQQLRDFETAIDNFSAALSGDARNATALAAVERYLVDPDLRVVAAEVLEPIYVAQHRWQDLIRVWQARLESTADPRDRLRLTRFIARLYEEQLEDFEHASHWYAKVFREAPSDPAIRDQLQRLASIVDNWEFVAGTYQAFLDDQEGEPADLRDVAIAAAGIYDRRLGDVDRAYDAYRRALAIELDGASPNERELIRRLEELLGRAEKWPELVTIYDDVVGRAEDELRREVLIKRARLLEEHIGDTARAVEGWREVVDHATAGTPATIADARTYGEAVTELERLYRMRAQWPELVELLESRISEGLARGAPPYEVSELRLRLAELQENQLADAAAAIDQYQQVLEEDAEAERAVAALERLVVAADHRERITELLEPVYRANDWWQKLVVILDAKLEYLRDPGDQVRLLHEIAQIHEERGGALRRALQALARAWRIDVADEESLAKLLSLAGRLGAWDETVTTLEEGAAAAPDVDLAGALWARTAEIHEGYRRDLPRAITAWRKVQEARPDDVPSLAALDRLLVLTQRYDELVMIVAQRAELAEDPHIRHTLLHRVAALYEEKLGDRVQAIAAYKAVLGVDDADDEALDALERLFRQDLSGEGNARELAQTLERKIELAADLPQRQQLRRAAAQVYEAQLADIYQAIGQLTAILEEDPADDGALGELDRIYAREKLWSELLDVIDRRAALAPSDPERAELAFRAAALVEHELTDPDGAVPRYGGVLQLVPSHGGARGALEALLDKDAYVEAVSPLLEQVYGYARQYERVQPGSDAARPLAERIAHVYERRLAVSVGDRRANWDRLAESHEILAGAPAQAFAVWSRAIEGDPDDAELLAPLLRLAASQGMWSELAARLDQLLGEPLAPDVEHRYAMQLGEIARDRLSDVDRAARAFERASHGAEPRPALTALEQVLSRAGRWPELAAVLRRQADAAPNDAETAEYLFRLGELSEATLSDARGAVAAYREVLGISAAHGAARGALERMLRLDAAHTTEIVEILEPLFEQDGDYARLAVVVEARLGVTNDPLDSAALLTRLVELYEQRLGDRPRALEAALRWLAVEPSSSQALADTDRLAGQLDLWPQVAQRVAAIARSPEVERRDPDTQVVLLVFLGRIRADRLGQLDEAAASYRAALAIDPDAIGALDELIKILRQRGDQPALAGALRQRGRAIADLPEKRAAFAEVAQICERAGDRAGAIAAWREIIEADDGDRAALDELARIHRGGPAESGALIEVLTHAARLAPAPGDEKRLRVEIAQLEGEGPRAIAAWQAVLDLDPEDPLALGSLERAHGKAGDWLAVSDLQTRRLALARTVPEQVAIHAEMARLAEGKRGSTDDAVASWYAALDADPAYAPAYPELERLLTAGGRWHDLVELLAERLAPLHASRGDHRAELAVLARAADLWESQLDSPEAAGEILEKILAREPGSVAALTRLSKIYERAGDWDRCTATLEEALRLGPTGRDAADLFFRLGEVARESDPETSVQHFQQALRNAPDHAGAIGALEQIARDRRDAGLLADMLGRRAAIAPASERVAILVELAELERKANRGDAALAALARAAEDAPTDPRVLGPLADLYFSAGRLDEAAPIYDRLAADAKAGRRLKELARFRQRQGGILEARGDRTGALAAYEEALRVSPSDVATMTGLGRLYFSVGEWEKARKIFQSLVLQTIDPDAGVSKGEAYWTLGRIHLQLGEPPKAKRMFQRGLELEPHNQQLKDALQSLP